MEKKTLFSENILDKKHNIKHHCDDNINLFMYQKNITLDELRRNLFYESQSWCNDKNKLILMYTENKNNDLLKSKNKELHNFFYNKKSSMLDVVLEKFNVLEFIQVPKCFKIPITNARFAWYDGNCLCFVGEANDNFFVIHWSGS